MEMVKLVHNGFHGRAPLRLRDTGNRIEMQDGSYQIEVSAPVARRLNKAVCPGDDCKCGEHVAHEEPLYSGRWVVSVPDTGIIRGNYPQD